VVAKESNMRERRIKPRVFLSHSKKDVDFIRKFENDLCGCQIEPWIDELEIRHGRPWLDEIFEAGMPSCHVVLVYITEHSIESSMVRKEIDAGILHKLADNNIGFMPYVSSEEMRPRLRSDIRSIQTPVFSAENYSTMYPKILSQIWMSYMDLAVSQAIQSEKVQRLELELKIQRLEQENKGSVFSSSEQKEFLYIWDKLNRNHAIHPIIQKKNTDGSPLTEHKNYILNIGALYLTVICKMEF
jgi:hypothetical protein